jgi:hypothetical protein
MAQANAGAGDFLRLHLTRISCFRNYLNEARFTVFVSKVRTEQLKVLKKEQSARMKVAKSRSY